MVPALTVEKRRAAVLPSDFPVCSVLPNAWLVLGGAPLTFSLCLCVCVFVCVVGKGQDQRGEKGTCQYRGDRTPHPVTSCGAGSPLRRCGPNRQDRVFLELAVSGTALCTPKATPRLGAGRRCEAGRPHEMFWGRGQKRGGPNRFSTASWRCESHTTRFSRWTVRLPGFCSLRRVVDQHRSARSALAPFH